MAIEIQIGSATYKCGSVEEAAALSRALGFVQTPSEPRESDSAAADEDNGLVEGGPIARAHDYVKYVRGGIDENSASYRAGFTSEVELKQALAVLRCDAEIQRLVNDGRIPLDAGARLADLDAETRHLTIKRSRRYGGGGGDDVDVEVGMLLDQIKHLGNAPANAGTAPTPPSPPTAAQDDARRTVTATPAAAPAAAPASTWRQPPALDVFWGRLDSHGREAIRMIATNDDLSISDLRAALKLPSTKHVSHVLAAVKRVAASVGIADWRDVFTYTISGARGERVSLYHAGPLLRAKGAVE